MLSSNKELLTMGFNDFPRFSKFKSHIFTVLLNSINNPPISLKFNKGQKED